MKLSKLRVDVDATINGIWQTHDSGIELRLARMHNQKMQDWLRVQRDDLTEISDEEAAELTVEAVARFVVLDWRNVEDDDGEPIDFTWEYCHELLKDPELEDLYRWILLRASKAERYRKTNMLKAEGESKSV